MLALSFPAAVAELLDFLGEPITATTGRVHDDGTATILDSIDGTLLTVGDLDGADDPLTAPLRLCFDEHWETVAVDPVDFTNAYRAGSAITFALSDGDVVEISRQ